MNQYNPNIHNRRSIRLQGYDYSQSGAYFITICTQNRASLFGHVVDGKMILNDAGMATQQCWLEIPKHFPNTILDEFVIMPNHVHGIIVITDINPPNVGVQNFEPLQIESPRIEPKQNYYQKIIPGSIGSIIRGFKIGVTKWFRQNTDVYHVWQRNYYEHIVRNQMELKRIREYIVNNPVNWQNDENYIKS